MSVLYSPTSTSGSLSPTLLPGQTFTFTSTLHETAEEESDVTESLNPFESPEERKQRALRKGKARAVVQEEEENGTEGGEEEEEEYPPMGELEKQSRTVQEVGVFSSCSTPKRLITSIDT